VNHQHAVRHFTATDTRQLDGWRLAGTISADIEHFYGARLEFARTQQEKALIGVISALNMKLQRPPSWAEVAEGLSSTGLERLSKDRLRQILVCFNRRLPKGVSLITLTFDRPFFRFYAVVEAVALRWFKKHGQSATREELVSELARVNVKVSSSVLNGILRSLRKGAHPVDRPAFSLSTRRLPVTWRNIVKAHEAALEHLKRFKIERMPSAAEVSAFLAREGHCLSARALTARMLNKPARIKIELSRHVDPARTVLLNTHKSLSAALRRPPTLRELTDEFNRVMLRCDTLDAVWARLKNLNQGRNKKTRLALSLPKRSKLYDVDIKARFKLLSKGLKRPPTFQELWRDVKAALPHVKVREDWFFERVSRLELQCSLPNELKKKDTMAIRGVMSDLRKQFGRRALREEVLHELSMRGVDLSPVDLNRRLGAAKKRAAPGAQSSFLLGFSQHLLGKLRATCEELRNSRGGGYPKISEVAAALGWTESGVRAALRPAQVRDVRRRRAPTMVADLAVAEYLENVETVVSSIFSRIDGIKLGRGDERRAFAGLGRLSAFVNGWDLPAITPSVLESECTVDAALLRCEIAWIHLVCMHAPGRAVSEELEWKARMNEAVLDRALARQQGGAEGFKGLIHALLIAEQAGRLGVGEAEQSMRQAHASSDKAQGWSVVRSVIQELAAQCGFPQYKPKARRVLLRMGVSSAGSGDQDYIEPRD
jgi:hypothetical protein